MSKVKRGDTKTPNRLKGQMLSICYFCLEERHSEHVGWRNKTFWFSLVPTVLHSAPKLYPIRNTVILLSMPTAFHSAPKLDPIIETDILPLSMLFSKRLTPFKVDTLIGSFWLTHCICLTHSYLMKGEIYWYCKAGETSLHCEVSMYCRLVVTSLHLRQNCFIS